MGRGVAVQGLRAMWALLEDRPGGRAAHYRAYGNMGALRVVAPSRLRRHREGEGRLHTHPHCHHTVRLSPPYARMPVIYCLSGCRHTSTP